MAERGGRVRITYQFQGEARELPFAIGVIGDFSGVPEPPLDRVWDRKFQDVHSRDLDGLMAKLRPRVVVTVENHLDGSDTSLRGVELRFREMRDFEPERIATQVEPLRALVAYRALLEDLRKELHRFPLIRDYVRQRLREGPPITSGTRESAASSSGRSDSEVAEALLADELGDRAGTWAGMSRWDDLDVRVDALRLRWTTIAADNSDTDLEAALCLAVARIDELLNVQVNAFLHHPEVRSLEASWRGLQYLANACEDDEMLIVRVLSIKKEELARDFELAAEFDLSSFWDKVYKQEYGRFGGEPFGLLVGDFDFDASSADVDLLEYIAGVAASAHAPFVAAASPSLFGWDSFDAALIVPDIEALVRGPAYGRWNSFRSSEDARYVGLTLPRILLRPPHQDVAKASAPFPFDEEAGGRDRSQWLFGSGAFAVGVRVARAFSAHHWCAAIRGLDGGLIDDLSCPGFDSGRRLGAGRQLDAEGVATSPADARRSAAREQSWAPRGPVEIDLTSPREQQLAELGFIPIVHCHGTGAGVIYSVPSCHAPASYNQELATTNARISAQLHYMLSVSRFAHYLKVMMRDRIGLPRGPEECERQLSDWLYDYCLPNPESASPEEHARKPLRSARVEVRLGRVRQGAYQASIWLQPHFQIEELRGEIDLQAIRTELRPAAASTT